MRYLAVALDYDGTLATRGKVPESVAWALAMLRQSGRRLVLVTGRLLPDLLEVFPHAGLFDQIVAENGGLLYTPHTRKEVPLAELADPRLVAALADRGVDPLEAGRVIVATREPHEVEAIEVIRELGLEIEIIFNKGAAMLLPSGVNKATGLGAALEELQVSPHNTVAIGDGENDHALLASCECGIAVAGAVDSLRERADFVTAGDRADGVIEIVEGLLADDLASLQPRLGRHEIPLGADSAGGQVGLAPYGASVLLAGPSGSGKSTLTTALLEGLSDRGYQYCVVDPEGDYETLEGAVVLGNQERPPQAPEILQLLARRTTSVVVNLIGLKLEDRPLFFEALLPDLFEPRTTTGRPHFLVVDEAHHLVPAQWERAGRNLPQEMESVLFVTVHPEAIAPAVLRSIDAVIAVGDAPGKIFDAFADSAGVDRPAGSVPGGPGQAQWWHPGEGRPVRFEVVQSRQERRRHVRKYAEGDLGDAFSFYFRGPDGRLNLKAQNLTIFLQLADGIDDQTWLHHLARGDYSSWFRSRIKDDDLADAAREVERMATHLEPAESRERVRALVEERYTLPA